VLYLFLHAIYKREKGIGVKNSKVVLSNKILFNFYEDVRKVFYRRKKKIEMREEGSG